MRCDNVRNRIQRVVVPLFCLLALICTSAVATPAQSTSPRQLTLIHPNDPEFDNLLTANFPGLDKLDGYALYRPFLVLLRNDTSHAVSAYMLQWDSRSSRGEPRRFANLIERYDPGLASQRVALTPGELRLVSERFDVGPKEFQSTQQHNWVATMLSTAQTKSRYLSVDPNSIIASVDAAVFDDGLCVGPDHYQLFMRYQREMDAEHDLAEEMLRLLDAKASEADIIAFLKAETDAAATANQSLSGSAFYYAFHRGRQAQKLLTLYKRGGIEGVMTQAWRVTQHPRKQLSLPSQ